MTTAEGGTMAVFGDTLVIGDKNCSSWSLRPWLALEHCGIPFAEERAYLDAIYGMPAMAEWIAGADAEVRSRKPETRRAGV